MSSHEQTQDAHPHTATTEERTKLREMIQDIRLAMLTTTDTDGSLRSRPMAVQLVEGDDNLYFFTHRSSPKVTEIRQDQQVNVAFTQPDDNVWVSVSGTGTMSDDRAKMKAMWNDILKAWFPEGLDDPDLGLLKVHPTQAEYWDSASGVLVTLFGYVKAVVTGKPHADELSDHKQLDLKGNATR